MKLTSIEEREYDRYLATFEFEQYIRGKTFLLTGCKGIVGSGIIKWLLLKNQRDNSEVSIIASTRTPEEIPSYIEEGDNISFCKFGDEKNYCKDKKIDYIIHAASPTGNTFHASNPVESLRVIIDETEKILEIACKNKGCSLIYLSSEEVYGLPKDETPIDETYVGAIDSLTVRSCYPLGKKVAELLCYNYSIEYNVDAKIIRPTVIHGLLQKYTEQRVVNEILRCVVENKNFVMKSSGLTKKCLMFSLDAISAIFTVLFKGEKGQAYNASNPNTFLTVKDLANHVFSKFNPNICIEFANTDISVSEGYLPKRTLLQKIDKLENLGWYPMTELDRIYSIDIERFSKKSGE
ncbi:MAG: NAD(P)-dependent oxidoreductase [Lachnospiraceae bacterium]|nr:NAD(P)-dependent oxidoreductase [Lachnospiraceae bacterium]